MTDRMDDNRFDVNDLKIDLKRARVTYKGENIYLSELLLRMLACLHSAAPDLLDRAKIFAAVWGNKVEGDDNTNFDKARRRLNEKLRPHGIEVRNEPRLGYRLAKIQEEGNSRDSKSSTSKSTVEFVAEKGKLRSSHVVRGRKPILLSTAHGLRSEVVDYFGRKRVSVTGIDWCVHLVSPADSGGWAKDEVRFGPIDRYEMPAELSPMLADYPLEGNQNRNDVYTLFDYSDLIGDQGHPLVINARPVGYEVEFSYLRGASISVRGRGKYRDSCEAIFSLKRSPLVHALAAHIIVLTKELDGTRRVVLNRRSELVHFFPSTWSVSLEEHMLAKHRDGKTKADKHPWDTARRGLEEELGISDSEIESLRLMGLYLEFNVWTVPMIFIAECALSFDEMVRRWPAAADPHESRVIDSIPATVEAIDSIFLRGGEWSPSVSAWYMNDRLRDADSEKISSGLTVATALHNTSAVRLHVLRNYLVNAVQSKS